MCCLCLNHPKRNWLCNLGQDLVPVEAAEKWFKYLREELPTVTSKVHYCNSVFSDFNIVEQSLRRVVPYYLPHFSNSLKKVTTDASLLSRWMSITCTHLKLITSNLSFL